jgi:hypothetical protein
MSRQDVRRKEMPGFLGVYLDKRRIADGAARIENTGYPPLLGQLSYLVENILRRNLHYFRTALESALQAQYPAITG